MTDPEIIKYNRRKKNFLLLFWGGWAISGIPLAIALLIWKNSDESGEVVKYIILATSCLGIILAIGSLFIALNWDLQTLQHNIQKRKAFDERKNI